MPQKAIVDAVKEIITMEKQRGHDGVWVPHKKEGKKSKCGWENTIIGNTRKGTWIPWKILEIVLEYCTRSRIAL